MTRCLLSQKGEKKIILYEVAQCDELLFFNRADIKPNLNMTHCRHVSAIIQTNGEKISAPDFELLLHKGHRLWSKISVIEFCFNRLYPVWSKSLKSGAEIFYAMVNNVGYICLKHALWEFCLMSSPLINKISARCGSLRDFPSHEGSKSRFGAWRQSTTTQLYFWNYSRKGWNVRYIFWPNGPWGPYLGFGPKIGSHWGPLRSAHLGWGL